MNAFLKSGIWLVCLCILIITGCQKKKSGIYTNALTTDTFYMPGIITSGKLYIMTPIGYAVNPDNATSAYWDFGDNITSHELQPVHSYDQPGAYKVSVRVTTPDTVFMLEKDVNIIVGTERLKKERRWHVRMIHNDKGAMQNGPGNPNPASVREFDTSFALNVISDYDIIVDKEQFFPDDYWYTVRFYSAINEPYEQSISYYSSWANGNVSISYYFNKDSMVMHRWHGYTNTQDDKLWGSYYGEYTTID